MKYEKKTKLYGNFCKYFKILIKNCKLFISHLSKINVLVN